MNDFFFTHPEMFWLLPLAILPAIISSPSQVKFSTLLVFPEDRLSKWIDRFIRMTGVLLILSLIAGVAGLHQAAYPVSKVGVGAHIVLLLDRSRSMDQPFATKEKITSISKLFTKDSKITVARRVLNDFVTHRENDFFGMLVFSTLPIPIVPLTNNHEIIKASINSSAIGRGLAQTNIGGGLESAIRLFDGKPFTGSRIVILISDGAALIDPAIKRDLKELMKLNRITIYWMYMRSATGPAILGPDPDLSPELVLHRFFQRTGTPYRAYMAEEPKDMERAVQDINTLQNLPLHYETTIPKKDYAWACFAVSAFLSLLLMATVAIEVRHWSKK